MSFGREILQDVEGYVPGEQPKDPDIIKLNTNENPYPPSPKALEALRNLDADALRKYPDPLAVRLREALAERYGYPGAEWVVVGNGMDELLAMAVRTFVDPGDEVVTTYPTYTLYETLARLHGTGIREIDLDDAFQLTEAFFEARGRMCLLPRPNAPSGVAPPREDVERLCNDFSGLVVIDEAYVDFADDTCLDFPRRFENAVVMRTFSKSFSLAGLRIGAAFARPEIINEFLKTKDSYNMNAASQAVALAALTDYDHMLRNTARIRATRGRLVKGLFELGFTAPPSQANFVLAQQSREPSAHSLFNALRARKILVRYFPARRLDNALRISVGTEEQTNALLNALRDILG